MAHSVVSVQEGKRGSFLKASVRVGKLMCIEVRCVDEGIVWMEVTNLNVFKLQFA